MAEPLSVDLRKRVVAAVKNGMSRRRAALKFQVGVSSAIRWTAQADASGDLAPKAMGGDRRSAAIEAQAGTILSLVAATPDSTLAELQAALPRKAIGSASRRSGAFSPGDGSRLKKVRARSRAGKTGHPETSRELV